MEKGSSNLLLPPFSTAAGVCAPLEKVVVGTEGQKVPPAWGWAGTPGWQPSPHLWLVALGGSPDPQPCRGVSTADPLGFNSVQRKKALLDSVPLLMKIRDLILLTAAQAGFAPEVCRLTLPFPDEAGLAGWIELGGLVLRRPEFVGVQPVTASLEKLLLLAVVRVTILLASK